MNLELPKEEEKDLDIETVLKAESEDNGQWQIEKGKRPSLNSRKLHAKDNSKE